VKKRLALMMGTVAALGLIGLGGQAEGQDEGPSIKKVMGKLHGKGKGLLPSVGKALQADSPNWPEIKKGSKLIAELASTITDLEPPKGDKENYAKLSKAYLASAKDLQEAADAEDADKGKAAAKKLMGTCKTCHTSHKGQ
jgi:cytochrome c556